MELIGTSSLLVEKYRPKTINDLILPAKFRKLFLQFVADKDIPNLLFTSTAGRGKTSTAYALCNDIGSDVLYINGSSDTDINTVRYKVTQFASTSSFSDGKKVCIIDEGERISPNGQDALKALIETTEANCRFIITTNNLAKIIDPIQSRCQLMNFNFSQEETKPLIVAYFKRLCYILDNEKIKYDKSVLAEFTQKMYPDFRRTLNELQKFTKMYGEVSASILQSLDGEQFNSLIEEMKNNKFNNVRKIAANIDATGFYQTFYSSIDDVLEDKCKPDIICLLGRYAYETSLTVCHEVTLVACLVDIMKSASWK
jgi:DNA polymerase III delta prime subunit